MKVFVDILILLNVIISLLIILFILLRRSKSGGISTFFHGNEENTNSLFGVHTDLYVNKFIILLIVLFFITVLSVTIITA